VVKNPPNYTVSFLSHNNRHLKAKIEQNYYGRIDGVKTSMQTHRNPEKLKELGII